jgi:hypothetical protein
MSVCAEIRYSAEVEDCNAKSNERELGESVDGVISASYRPKSKRVANYNWLL